MTVEGPRPWEREPCPHEERSGGGSSVGLVPVRLSQRTRKTGSGRSEGVRIKTIDTEQSM